MDLLLKLLLISMQSRVHWVRSRWTDLREIRRLSIGEGFGLDDTPWKIFDMICFYLTEMADRSSTV